MRWGRSRSWATRCCCPTTRPARRSRCAAPCGCLRPSCGRRYGVVVRHPAGRPRRDVTTRQIPPYPGAHDHPGDPELRRLPAVPPTRPERDPGGGRHRAAARAPARSPSYDEDTTTHGRGRRPARRWRPLPTGVSPAVAVVRHREPGLPRQDQRHRRPRRAAAADRRSRPTTSTARSARPPARCGPAWLTGTAGAGRRGRPAHRPAGLADEADRRRRGRRAAGRHGRRRAAAGRGASAPAAPPRSSSTAGARPATPARSCGRSASARPATSPSASPPGRTRCKAAGARRRPGRPRRRRRLARPGRRHRSASKLGLGDTPRRRPRRHRRQHRRRPARPAARRTRSTGPRPARSSPSSCWPTAPTSCCSAPPRRWPRPGDRRRRCADQVGGRRTGRLRQVPRLAGLPAGRAAPPARAGPPVGLGRRPVDADWKFGFVGSQDDGRRRPPAAGARRRPPPGRWPTPPARSSPSRSTGSPTRRPRRSCSPSSTSTAAAGCPSS